MTTFLFAAFGVASILFFQDASRARRWIQNGEKKFKGTAKQKAWITIQYNATFPSGF